MKKGFSLLQWGKFIKRGVKFLKDKQIPKYKKLLFILPIFYIFLPIDLVTDFLPVFGWLDDVVIVTVVWNFFLQELKSYDESEVETREATDEEENSGEGDSDYILTEDDYRVK